LLEVLLILPIEVRLYASFAASDHGGNIAGIVYDRVELSSSQMQAIAADLGAPTTGFVRRLDKNTFCVRFFSRRSEMDMCGHVTIAIYTSLYDDGQIEANGNVIAQITPGGKFLIRISEDAGILCVSMSQQPPVFDIFDVDRKEISKLLGISVDNITNIGSASTALKHLFVQLGDQAALANMQPVEKDLLEFSLRRKIDTIGVWCLQTQNSSLTKVRVRDLCHGVGDAEEAASGTTNGALACHLWRRGLAVPNRVGTVSVEAEQGFEMNKPSRIFTQLTEQDGAIVQVIVGGKATCRMRGQWLA
jgi:trans-2,3-dihydro-3-hydroxyanthranilate isomerase